MLLFHLKQFTMNYHSIFTFDGLNHTYHLVSDTICAIFKNILYQIKVLNTVQRLIIGVYFLLVLVFFSMAIYYAMFKGLL